MSIRFKMSVLTKVLPCPHHHSVELRNWLSVTHHKLGATPSSIHRERIQCRKQFQNWLQLRAHQQRESWKPCCRTQFFHSHDFLTIWEYRSYSDSPWLWRTKKKDAEPLNINRWPQPQKEFRSWKTARHQSRYTMDLWCWECSNIYELITLAPNTGLRETESQRQRNKPPQ